MGITTYPTVTAANIGPATAIPPAGLRRSSSTWTPATGEPLTTASGVTSSAPRYSLYATTVNNASIGMSFYTPGSGWRPGYRIPNPAGSTILDLGINNGVGGLLFGSMKNREGAVQLGTSAFQAGTFAPIPLGPHQFLPVLGAVDWTMSFRLRFTASSTAAGSGSSAATSEGTPQIRIAQNPYAGGDYVSIAMTSYANNGTNRVGYWNVAGTGSTVVSSNNTFTGNTASTIFASVPNYCDWTFAFVAATQVCTVTMTPNSAPTGTAGAVTLTSTNGGPQELSLSVGGFATSLYPNLFVDNVTLTTGLSDY